MRTPEEERLVNIKAKKNLMWLGIISIFMLFAGLTSAYVVAMGKPGFVPVEVPSMFWVSAVIISISSISIIYAVKSAKNNRFSGVSLGILISLILGIAFTYTQVSGWKQLVAQEIFFADHPSGQYLYMLSGVHLAHLVFGLLSLLFVLFRSFRQAYKATETLGLEVAAMYWHFLGILWIYLLLFLQFVR